MQTPGGHTSGAELRQRLSALDVGATLNHGTNCSLVSPSRTLTASMGAEDEESVAVQSCPIITRGTGQRRADTMIALWCLKLPLARSNPLARDWARNTLYPSSLFLRLCLVCGDTCICVCVLRGGGDACICVCVCGGNHPVSRSDIDYRTNARLEQ